MSVINNNDIKSRSGYPKRPTDRRHQGRKRVLGAVKLLFGGFSKSVFDCLVIDQSPRGMRVQVGSTIMIPNELIVEFSNGTRRRARLVWASGDEVGIEYED